ncbi:MAG TPA: hypothetical protein VKA89_02410 [Solirubrobacterales bacterium]|nr:hypothetical protein [Solirubrobacterales bacterium]
MNLTKAFRGRRPSPAMIIALVALFAALGGTATALRGKNSVRSDDIAKGAVRTSDIRSGAVKVRKLAPNSVDPFKLNVAKLGARAAELTTTSTAPADLGGPHVTVKVPKGALVAIFAEVTMRITGAGTNNEAQVRLFEPGTLANSPTIMATGSNAFENRFTTPGPGAQNGAGGDLRGGWLVYSAGSGVRTFSLRYAKQGGGTAIFRNPRLWVTVIR